MTSIRHKYNAHEVSNDERARTFAARQKILSLILKRLEGQAGTSFLITGPRGAGKSTLLHMVQQKIHETAELSKHWLPVILPEEQIGVTSLRDLLAVILEMLANNSVSMAEQFYQQCEEEPDEELLSLIHI